MRLTRNKPIGKRTPKQIERDLELYQRQLEAARQEGVPSKLATVLNNLGTIEMDRKRYAEALSYCEEALAVLDRSCPPDDHVTAYGNAASAARGLKDWERAVRYALYAETTARHSGRTGDLDFIAAGLRIVRHEAGLERFTELLNRESESLPTHLAPLLRRDLHLMATFLKGEQRYDRNAPCPCGSGRKYKKCCLSVRFPGHAAENAATGEGTGNVR